MEQDTITEAEVIACLEELARLIEAKATTVEEAVEMIRHLKDRINK